MKPKSLEHPADVLVAGILRLPSDIVVPQPAIDESDLDGDVLEQATLARTLNQMIRTPQQDMERPCLRLYAPSPDLDDWMRMQRETDGSERDDE